MPAKTVKALYVGSAPARLDPEGVELVPGETVVELDAATVEANAIWQRAESPKPPSKGD